MRYQRPRRSLAAVVSPASSLQSLPPVENEDVFCDETVRVRPSKSPVAGSCSNTTGGAPGAFRMRTEGPRAMALPTVEDDEDPNDITLQAPPDLVGLRGSQAESSQHAPAAGRRKMSERSAMPTSSSAPVFSFDGRSLAGTASASKTVLSNSPTLNQSSTLSDAPDAATVRAGPASKKRAGRSTVVATGAMHREDAKPVSREFFPGIQGDPSAPHTSRQAIAKPPSSRLAPSQSAGGWRGRVRSKSSTSDDGAAAARRGHALLRSRAAAVTQSDDDGDVSMDARAVGRSVSRMGWSLSDDDYEADDTHDFTAVRSKSSIGWIPSSYD